MLINEKAFDGAECPYHVIDWKSSKLPRVTRSSLGAKAQAARQAEDSVDFLLVWTSYVAFGSASKTPTRTWRRSLRDLPRWHPFW